MAVRCALVLLALAGPLAGIDRGPAADMSGSWKLNVERSVWNDVRKPIRQTVVIDHREPSLRYGGTVLYASEETRDFSFEGAIDGNPYPMTRSFGAGKIVMRRFDANTIDSVFRTDDGLYEETARTRLSADGRTLTRSIRFKSPEKSYRWVEVYNKQ
jgi:hypothetical protein